MAIATVICDRWLGGHLQHFIDDLGVRHVRAEDADVVGEADDPEVKIINGLPFLEGDAGEVYFSCAALDSLTC